MDNCHATQANVIDRIAMSTAIEIRSNKDNITHK